MSLRFSVTKIFWGLLLAVVLIACNQPLEEKELNDSKVYPYIFEWPEGFPVPAIPSDNALTPERIALGEMLFYEPALSIDSSLSCSSCHFPEFAFSDGRRVSVGFHGQLGTRNAQGLTNVAYAKEMFRDGGSLNLEMQVQGPVEAENEMGFNMKMAAERLSSCKDYNQLAQEAYGRDMDVYVFTRALAAYQRTLVSGNSAYDRYNRGDEQALTPQELRGMDLFFSDRTGCINCHSGFNFSDATYRNIGLYTAYEDTGRARITGKPEDSGKFRVPTLRNVSLTAPYMHDGSMATLHEVVRFYETGGKPHRNLDPDMQPFRLSDEERDDMVKFLEALTDTSFIRLHLSRKPR